MSKRTSRSTTTPQCGAGILLIIVALLLLMVDGLAGHAQANHIPFLPGDVFAGVGFGQVKHFAPDGTLLEILDTTTGSFVDTGMCFDASGNLYTTNLGDDSMSKFDSTGLLLQAHHLTGFDASPESCLFDAAGNLYVGLADGTHNVLKFDPAGTLLATFSPAPENRGTDWIELAADQCTLFYTSEGASIKRFNVCTNTQLSDFCTTCGPDQPAFRTYGLFAPRLHADGSLLVVDQDVAVIRRFDSSGVQIQSYPMPAPDDYLVPPPGDGTPAAPFALTLDPDGTSFWTADVNSGRIFRFDIATGVLVTQFDGLTQAEIDDGTVLDLEGLAVFGEFRAATQGAGSVSDVAVVNTAAQPSINTGDPAQFTIQVTALGPGASTNVVLTDTLPAGLSWTIGGADAAACSPASPVPGGTVLSCSFGPLAQGATKTISLTAITSAAVCPAITNTASVSATDDSNPTNNSSGPVTISVQCPTPVTASITAASKTYDATTAATITSCTLSGVLSTDDVSCATSGAAFATASVGNGKPVSATVSLTGSSASHYVLSSTSATTTADITPALAAVTPNPASKTYGAADPAFTGTLTGFLAADNVTATYSRTAGETVAGSPYTISATLSPAGALSNYTITYNAASFTITKATASVTPNAASKVYGAANPALTGTLSGFLAADGVTASYSRTAGESVAGSPYPISATLSPAGVFGNYTITANTAAFTITKATPGVTWANPADITYPAPLSSTQLNATANVPGAFGYTPPAGTVLSPGNNQLLSVLFTPTDNSNYTTASAQAHINVLQSSASCPEDPNANLTRAVDHTGAAHGSVPIYTTVQAAYNAAQNGDVIGMFSQTSENVTLGGAKTLTITQCTVAKITANTSTQPVWNITSTGALTIIGPDAVGGTIGWRIATAGHTVKSVRSTGASQYGILILGNNNSVSVNSVSGSPVGIRVTGNTNDLRPGGAVSGNSGNGVEVGPTATGNTIRIGNIQSNGGNGVQVDGSGNTVSSNGRVDSNALNGILVNGNNNSIKNNAAGSDKGKGNTQAGIKVAGGGNTLDNNVSNANGTLGVDILGAGNKLKSHQSNQTASGKSDENGGCEYRFADNTTLDQGGNKKDSVSFVGGLSGPKYAAGCSE